MRMQRWSLRILPFLLLLPATCGRPALEVTFFRSDRFNCCSRG